MRGFQQFFDEFLKDRDATAAGEKIAPENRPFQWIQPR